MKRYPIPPVPELARVEGESVSEVAAWLLSYYSRAPVNWNYLPGTKAVRASYQGLGNLRVLMSGCGAIADSVGRKANLDVVQLAAPVAFGRSVSVFDLPRRKFNFGQNLQAAYRVPFFFLEDGVIKLYFLQPRKSASLQLDQLGMLAKIYQKFILDEEFFGQRTNIEFVCVAASPLTKQRELKKYTIDELPVWSDKRLQERLTLIVEGLKVTWDSGLIAERVRRVRSPDADMPLFD